LSRPGRLPSWHPAPTPILTQPHTTPHNPTQPHTTPHNPTISLPPSISAPPGPSDNGSPQSRKFRQHDPDAHQGRYGRGITGYHSACAFRLFRTGSYVHVRVACHSRNLNLNLNVNLPSRQCRGQV
jgi:hypothetical protein